MSFLRPSQDPYISLGLNNLVAKETHVGVEVNKSSSFLTSHSSEKTDSPAERPKYNFWPVLKRAVASNLVETTKVVHKLKASHSSPLLTELDVQFNTFAPSTLKAMKEGSLLARRKVSFPDLGIVPMTTVQEYCMDSPTIPGRFPVHERSNSAPEVAATRTPFEDSMRAPITEPFILFAEDDDFLRAAEIDDKRQGAVANMTAPAHTTSSDSEELTPTQTNPLPGLDKPPTVPPKSPRMTGRSPVVGQGRIAFKFSSPSRKAPLRVDTNQSSKTEGSDKSSTRKTHITTQSRQGDLPSRAATAMGLRLPDPLATRDPHQRCESALAGTYISSKELEQSRIELGHRKGNSETSIMGRGRPSRRPNHHRDRIFRKLTSAERSTFLKLPSGFDISEAQSRLAQTDVEKLQYQAKGQAQKFKVLGHKDVKTLSQELRVLDERSDYLRNTHKSLRAGRNSLHQRMITYLRSPGVANVCRENMLRQEEALAELDVSIDEWVLKLEEVENRRTRVRQKLLEHVAASLILTRTTTSQSSRQQQTPPLSPLIVDESGTDVARQESIKIYADSKVYADANVAELLADIERQMERMSEAKNSPSRPEDSTVV